MTLVLWWQPAFCICYDIRPAAWYMWWCYPEGDIVLPCLDHIGALILSLLCRAIRRMTRVWLYYSDWQTASVLTTQWWRRDRPPHRYISCNVLPPFLPSFYRRLKRGDHTVPWYLLWRLLPLLTVPPCCWWRIQHLGVLPCQYLSWLPPLPMLPLFVDVWIYDVTNMLWYAVSWTFSPVGMTHSFLRPFILIALSWHLMFSMLPSGDVLPHLMVSRSPVSMLTWPFWQRNIPRIDALRHSTVLTWYWCSDDDVSMTPFARVFVRTYYARIVCRTFRAWTPRISM